MPRGRKPGRSRVVLKPRCIRAVEELDVIITSAAAEKYLTANERMSIRETIKAIYKLYDKVPDTHVPRK